MDDYVSKPIDPEELEDKVRRFLDEQLEDRKRELEAAEQRRLIFEAKHPDLIGGTGTVTGRLQTMRTEMRGIDADIAAAKVALVETEAAIDGELAESATRREAAVQSLPADVLVRYQRSLPSFGASTVVRFSGTDCSGCPYSMPSMEADRVKGLDAGTLAECSECGRLVVR